MIINGLRVPTALIDAVEKGEWKTPASVRAWHSLFSADEVSRPHLYSLSEIQSASSSPWWLEMSDTSYLGKPDEGFVPGDIDPRQSLLVADLGPDRLVALDYRLSPDAPTVIALSGDDDYWIKVTNDVESFILKLGLKRNKEN